MPNRILSKRSGVSTAVPSAANLAFGEIAINYADGNLFFKHSSNVVTVIASTQFSNVSGNSTANYFIGNGSQLSGINSFGTVEVVNQGNIVASGLNQAITLEAGTGIGISTDVGNSAITVISAYDIWVVGGSLGLVEQSASMFYDFGTITTVVDVEYPLGTVVFDGVITDTSILDGTITGNKFANDISINTTGSITADTFSGTMIFSIQGYEKTSDVTGAGNVSFDTDPYINQGSSFGTMDSGGIFTFTSGGVYQITVAYNVSADPDAWGGINGLTGIRYNQASFASETSGVKSSTTDVISVSINDTYTWKTNNSVTVYGTGNTKTRIQFLKIG